MNSYPDDAVAPFPARSSDWKLFFGLSRTPHGVLDLATPAMAALLWLGSFPPLSVMVVGILTAFAGYTAVYALNDIVDFRMDRERLALRAQETKPVRVDEILVRHPLAQGLLPFNRGLFWFIFWAALALAGAWWLNPFCAVLFGISACMEILYCKLLKVTHLKIIPSAIVKATGGLAGVYAVDPFPSPGFVAVLFLWLAAWEVGGQNIPNDIVDMEDDSKISARTTSTVKGIPESVFRVLVSVGAAAMGGIVIYWLSPGPLSSLYPIGAAALGSLLLLQPAHGVYCDPGPRTAAVLFNRGSYMPVSFLVLVALCIVIPF